MSNYKGFPTCQAKNLRDERLLIELGDSSAVMPAR
jgi:hypothetical protein